MINVTVNGFWVFTRTYKTLESLEMALRELQRDYPNGKIEILLAGKVWK